MPEMTHIDEWLDDISRGSRCDHNEAYARFVFEYFRYPAWKQHVYSRIMSKFKLFCTYDGTRYRVTGASRLGDVWLALDPERDTGYDLRVDVAACGEWGPSL